MASVFDTSGTTSSHGPESVSARLDAICEVREGLDAAAYFDLQSGVLLGTSSHPGKPHEVIEEQCAQAERLFAEDGAASEQVIVATRRELTVLQELSSDPGCALCLSFDHAAGERVASRVAEAIAQEWVR